VIIDWDGEGSRKVSKERIVQVPSREEKAEPNDVEGTLKKNISLTRSSPQTETTRDTLYTESDGKDTPRRMTLGNRSSPYPRPWSLAF
jgi:hypothetical protein